MGDEYEVKLVADPAWQSCSLPQSRSTGTMPDADGLSALEEIRSKSPDTPVVMMSTYDNPTYVARSVALGADDFVLKGSSREELLQAIERAATGLGPRATVVTSLSASRNLCLSTRLATTSTIWRKPTPVVSTTMGMSPVISRWAKSTAED